MRHLQCGWFKPTITMVYYTQITSYNYSVHGVYKQTYNWVKRCHAYHPSVISIFNRWIPFPVMGG